jgi:putative IMPACT (imprinted ancient) family translation regulator
MQKLSLSLEQNYILSYKRKILPNVIIDRKSKYTVVWWYIRKKEDIKKFMWDLLIDKYFKKATHNSYAYRILLENWSILEWKNDDWETGAWNCILRELQRENMVNVIVVVTRYFWWIHLNADRFKNVINATKEILKFKKEI